MRVRDQRSDYCNPITNKAIVYSLLHLVTLLGIGGLESLDEQLAILEESSTPDLLRVNGLDQAVLQVEQGLE